MFAVGIVIAVLTVLLGQPAIAAAVGWASACLVFLIWIWAVIGRLDGAGTKSHAYREDPTRPVSDALLLVASVASLVVVVLILMLPSGSGSGQTDLRGGVAIVTIVLSWALVHTLYTLRYAVLYYPGTQGGISFNQEELPRYGDFAYLAFTLGMTFQVSDTNISSSVIRMTVLRHSLLSYLFGAVILGTLINVVAGFSF